MSDHPLQKSNIMTMICKKCKKAFRKDVADMEAPDEADEYCPHCDNHFLREAITKNAAVGLSGQTKVEDIRKQQTYGHSWLCAHVGLFRIIGCRVVECNLHWRLW